MSGTACTALFAAADALWVGTSGAGIVRFSGGVKRVWAPGEQGLPRGRVVQILEAAGQLLALVAPDRIARLEGEGWRAVSGPEGFVHRLAGFRGRLWAASSAGLFRFEPGGWVRQGPAQGVTALAPQGERELWAATDSGVLRGLESGELASPEPVAEPVRALLAQDGRVFAGRYGRLSVHGTEMASAPVEAPLVSSMGTAGNVVLVGTWGAGVMAWSSAGWRMLARRHGLPSDRVNDVAGVESYVAVATEDGLAVAALRAGCELPTDEPARPERADSAPLDLAIDPARLGLRLAKPDPHPRQILASEARGGEMPPLARLGDVLFEDPTILGPRAQALGISCGSCHPGGDTNPSFFIPGLSGRPGTIDLSHRFFSAAAHNELTDPVDIPSLRGARLTGPYGHDGRTGSLREFIRNVVVLEFAGAEPSARDLDALTAYVNEFEFLPNSSLARTGRLVATAPLPAQRGEKLFRQERPGLGGKSCASCHDPGSHFTDRLSHDVGSGGSYDTPSLLGSLRTAPYFHDGSRETLADVVEHFDRAFGLKMSVEEKRDLTAYLEAVGDVDQPWAEPAQPAAPGPERRNSP